MNIGVRFPVSARRGPRGDRSPVTLKGWSDANWASTETDRKSVSCGVIQADGCVLYTFARRQSVIATSSGESEFFALTATADETIFFTKLLDFMGSRSRPRSSPTAALRSRSVSAKALTLARRPSA